MSRTHEIINTPGDLMHDVMVQELEQRQYEAAMKVIQEMPTADLEREIGSYRAVYGHERRLSGNWNETDNHGML